MKLQRLKNILIAPYYEPTRLSGEYASKQYAEQTVIKNSIGWSLALFIAAIILSIFLISESTEKGNKPSTMLFCLFITVVPLYYLLDRRPVMTVSSKGILFKNGVLKAWNEIEGTFTDTGDSCSLIIRFNDAGEKTVGLRDRSHSLDEICHMIEYCKAKSIDAAEQGADNVP
jgi:hypothetical protein